MTAILPKRDPSGPAGALLSSPSRRLPFRLAVFCVAFALLSLIFAWQVGWFGGRTSFERTIGLAQVSPEMGPTPQTIGAEGPRLTWLGHAGYLVEWRGVKLALDPNLSDRCKMVPRLTPAPLSLPHSVDGILISHAHYDHMDLPTLRRFHGKASLVLPAGAERHLTPELARRLRSAPLLADQEFTIGPLTVTAVRAAHQGGRSHPIPVKTKALGYMISDGVQTLYYSGDTAASLNFPAMAARFKPDLAILPIGAFQPRLPLKYHHMSPEEAVEAARQLGVKRIFPCHFGTFRLAFDAPDTALPRFARAANAAGIPWSLPLPPAAKSIPAHKPTRDALSAARMEQTTAETGGLYCESY